MVSTAKTKILERIMVFFAVDASLIGRIIGRRGETICHLRDDCDVELIKVKERTVYLW